MGLGILVFESLYEITPAASLSADFTADVWQGAADLEVNFTDLSTGAIISWSWTFGDGSNSSIQNPSHEFIYYGTFPITLTVSDGITTSSITKYVYVSSGTRLAYISGTLVLDGDVTINSDVVIAHSGVVIPTPDPDISKTFYQYGTNTYKTANGKGRTITSNTGNIIIEGTICGRGQGFESNRGPGCNSLLMDSSGNIINGYGASHAGLGYVDMTSAIAPSPNSSYGNWETPVSLGSGAGYYHPPLDYKGVEVRGGGAVKLVARSGTILVNGMINMNGEDGTYAGGAAGGSAWLVGWFIDGTGTISSEGGSTILSADAGGGGGGYISLWYDQANTFSGVLTVDGKSGGGEGKIFTKQIEPILEDRFTGNIWNTKWWDHTGMVSIHNDLTLDSSAADYNFPEVDSRFTVSGKEITASLDFIPDSTEINEYSAEFLLYADPLNWVGLAIRQTGIFGVSSVNGSISASGVPYDDTNVTLRLLKNDSTFIYQYYDSTSAPQTIYSDVRPELANRVFNIKMSLNKPLPEDTLRTEYLRLTNLDISNEYFQLDGTPSDQSAVALNALTGTSQYYGLDFYVEGNKVKWDSSGLSGFQSPFMTVITDYFTLTANDIATRSVELSEYPTSPEDVAVNVLTGSSQYYITDFIVIGKRVDWAGRGLESLLAEGDEIRVVYYFNPWNIETFADLIAAGDEVRTMYLWDYTSADNISTSFDNLKIFDGVVKRHQTTEPVIYVDPDYGSDSSSGRQLEPIKNLFVATAWSKEGGTVVLYDGTHNPTSVSRKDITIRGAEGVKPLITSQYVQDTTGSGWENTAVSFYGCQGLVENITISDTTNGIIVENGDFSIIRNTITDTPNPISFINCDPVVARNRIGNCNYALDFTAARFPEIYSNTIYDASVAVRLLNSPDATISCNTFDNNQTHIVMDTSSHAIISSNNLTYCVTGIQASVDSSTYTYTNNFYEAATNWTRIPEVDQSNIDVNPLYYDRFNRDYHLNPASPDIDVGTLDYDSYKIDYDGATRVPLDASRTMTDIGSYMHIDGSSPSNDFYVQSRGDDHWNFGGIDDPFRTLDKAMVAADSTIHIDGGHYDSFYLNLKEHNVELNQLYIYTSLPDHFVSYVTLTATDVANKYVTLPTFVGPDDTANVGLNVVGGPAQVFGLDYSVQYGSLTWDGYVLEDFLDTGDTLRILFEGPLQYKALNTIVFHQHYSNYDQEKAIFVSTGGSDSTVLGGDGTNSGGDGSFDRPYRTISMALSQSSPGDNIVAMAGEYPIFDGLDDRRIVVGIDRTSVQNKTARRVYEEFFNPEDFRAYGAVEYESIPWTLNYAGDSTIYPGGGFLNLTYDGTNTASAVSSYSMESDWEITTTLRNTIDPLKLIVSSPDNTAYFYYNDSDCTGGVVTGGVNYHCTSTLVSSDDITELSYITEYIALNNDHIRNKAVPLSFIPEPSDCSNVALNIVGGVSQNYGEDFYIENSMIKWDGMELDGDLEAGEVLRIIYSDRELSDPVTVSISLINDRFTIKTYNSGWNTLIARDMVGDYTGYWSTQIVMDEAMDNVSHNCIYGRGFVSKYTAVADSFINMSLDERYDVRTERKTLILYEDRT